MARKMTPVEFAYLREQLAKKSRRTGGLKGIAKRTGRSISCLQYVSKAKTFERYVEIRPVPHFKKPAGQLGLVSPGKTAPLNPPKAVKPAKAVESRQVVSGDELIATLKQNMIDADRITKMDMEQRAKLIQSNYVVSNGTKSLTLAITSLNRDQWIRFGVLLLIVLAGIVLVFWK